LEVFFAVDDEHLARGLFQPTLCRIVGVGLNIGIPSILKASGLLVPAGLLFLRLGYA
jgi:hypothetical protein